MGAYVKAAGLFVKSDTGQKHNAQAEGINVPEREHDRARGRKVVLDQRFHRGQDGDEAALVVRAAAAPNPLACVIISRGASPRRERDRPSKCPEYGGWAQSSAVSGFTGTTSTQGGHETCLLRYSPMSRTVMSHEKGRLEARVRARPFVEQTVSIDLRELQRRVTVRTTHQHRHSRKDEETAYTFGNAVRSQSTNGPLLSHRGSSPTRPMLSNVSVGTRTAPPSRSIAVALNASPA